MTSHGTCSPFLACSFLFMIKRHHSFSEGNLAQRTSPPTSLVEDAAEVLASFAT